MKLDTLADEIEQKLELIGSTAIEDKLQENVGQTIKDIKKAGIQLWVLTGDKIETAINIGYSCELLNTSTKTFIIDELDHEHIKKQISDSTNQQKRVVKQKNNAVVVAGDTLLTIQKYPEDL